MRNPNMHAKLSKRERQGKSMPTSSRYDLKQAIAPKQATKGKDATKHRQEKAQKTKEAC